MRKADATIFDYMKFYPPGQISPVIFYTLKINTAGKFSPAIFLAPRQIRSVIIICPKQIMTPRKIFKIWPPSNVSLSSFYLRWYFTLRKYSPPGIISLENVYP